MDKELLTARLFFKAAFPVMKVPLRDDPVIHKTWKKVRAKVQFSAAVKPSPDSDGADRIGVCLDFDHGELTVREELCAVPDLTLHFPNLGAMNSLLRGGLALPRISGALRRPGLLVKTLMLLMRLTLMLPRSRPKDELRQYLKVKMSIYMITTALSVYNKLRTPEMRAWTENQPDRIYQFTIEPWDEEKGIAAYLRVKNGRTKAGRGIYTRRRPFVHFRFSSVTAAMKVLLKEVGFVEGVEAGYVTIDGSPEYSAQLNDHMAVLQGLMT